MCLVYLIVYDFVKNKEWRCKRRRKLNVIARFRADSAPDSVAYLIKWKLDCRSCKQKQNDKTIINLILVRLPLYGFHLILY